MIDKVFEFLESFEELDGINHILAMHILCETSLKAFFVKHSFGKNTYLLCEKSNFDFYTIKKALTLHYPEKLNHVEEGLDLFLRLFNLNIFANHENNPGIGELRLEFPWLHEEYSKMAGFDESEILKIYNEAKLSINKLNSIELPSCYKKNVTASKSSRVLP